MPHDATDNSKTLLRLLADWRKIDFQAELPEKGSDLEAWRRACEVLSNNFLLTIQFADWHIPKLVKEDRYYFTLLAARRESLDGRRLCKKMLHKMSVKDFHRDAQKLKAHYDTFVSLFITLYELREPLLQERAEAAL